MGTELTLKIAPVNPTLWPEEQRVNDYFNEKNNSYCQVTESKPGILFLRVEPVVLGYIWLNDWYFMMTNVRFRIKIGKNFK